MEMESSLSDMTFKGSIIEGITEAKRQKKLFVVYLSGDDADTSTMERSTWRSLNVTESVSKYCILLHLPAESTDGTQFSAIYPQKSIPSITAVGYNGVQLWQHEGFVDAEVLASSLEKAWLSLHIQETTATFLTAALASKKSEVVSDSAPPWTSTSTSSNLRMSTSAALSSAENNPQIPDNKPMVVSENVVNETIPEQTVEKKDIVIEKESETFDTNELKKGENEDSSPTETAKDLLDHHTNVGDPDNSGDNHQVQTYDSYGSVNDPCEQGGSPPISVEDIKSQDKRTDAVGDKENEIFTFSGLNKSNEVHLNIRLVNGVSLQEKFSLTSTLQMVKEYIDNNQASDFGSYDLAIPYPRKVFNNQDLGKSLSELGLCNRQALVVVPHKKPTSDGKQGFPSFNPTTSTYNADSAENKEGYFAFVKWILSFANPFSYLGGRSSSSNSEQESRSGMWQYSPNATHRSGISDSSYSSPSQNSSESGRNDSRSRRPSTSQFGSNIHTLKHDEDDERFNRGNSFWNGNSTQYGGNGEAK